MHNLRKYLKSMVLHIKLSSLTIPKLVANKELKWILEKTIEHDRRDCYNKLDDALWAYMIAYKTPLRATLYRLVY